MFSTPKFEIAGLKFEGGSLAGIGTSIGAPDFGICFDVANGPKHLMHYNFICLTHCHSDHASGLPYFLSQKALHTQKAPTIFAPESVCEDLHDIIKAYAKLEDHEYNYDLRSVTIGRRFEISDTIHIVPFQTIHRVPCLGYTILERRKKLKKEFQYTRREDLIQMRESGKDLYDWTEIPQVSFTGDTQIEVFEKHPELLKSKVLFIECTFYDELKPVSAARKWGHIHFEELLPYVEKFEGNKLALMHFSARYRPEQLQKILEQKLPNHLDKIALVPSLYK